MDGWRWMKKPIWSSPNPRLELEGVADPRDPPVRLEGKQPLSREVPKAPQRSKPPSVEDAGMAELQALEAEMAVEPDDRYEPSIFGDDQPLADPGESEAILQRLRELLRQLSNPKKLHVVALNHGQRQSTRSRRPMVRTVWYSTSSLTVG